MVAAAYNVSGAEAFSCNHPSSGGPIRMRTACSTFASTMRSMLSCRLASDRRPAPNWIEIPPARSRGCDTEEGRMTYFFK